MNSRMFSQYSSSITEKSVDNLDVVDSLQHFCLKHILLRVTIDCHLMRIVFRFFLFYKMQFFISHALYSKSFIFKILSQFEKNRTDVRSGGTAFACYMVERF